LNPALNDSFGERVVAVTEGFCEARQKESTYASQNSRAKSRFSHQIKKEGKAPSFFICYETNNRDLNPALNDSFGERVVAVTEGFCEARQKESTYASQN